MVWIQFAICLAIITIAGSRLSKYADIIARKSGLGHVWVGIVLLATVTSMPEIATGISSVAIIQNPDLAVGDLFGASLLNLAIIAVIDTFYTKGPALHFLGTDIVLATILSMLLIAAAATSIILSHGVINTTILGFIGLYSPILFGIYLISQYMLFRFKTKQSDTNNDGDVLYNDCTSMSLKRTILFFSISGIAIIAAGIWLGFIGDQISNSTGLKASFVGTLFLAICTTAPELVVSISAARMGAIEMAVANVVGSNLFNIGVILFINDLFFAKGPILQFVSDGHVLTALFALMMSSIVIIGIIFHPKLWVKGWVGIDSTIIALLYVAALVTLFYYGR